MTEVTKLATVQESKQNTENNNSRRNTGYLEDTFDDRPIRWNHWISPAEIELESPPLGEGSYGTVFRGKCRGAIGILKKRSQYAYHYKSCCKSVRKPAHG